MKDWFVRLVFVGTIGAALYWGWAWFFPGPEQLIRKKLTELAAVASITPNETPLTKLAKAQRLSSSFTRDAQVTVDIPGRPAQTYSSREEIQEAALGARAIVNNLKIEFVDISVAVNPDKKSALAHLTATATFPGERVPEVQELELGFVKVDRDWLINLVRGVKTLR